VTRAPPPPPQFDLEPGVDRPGSDYTMIGLPAPDPNLCRSRCAAEPQCKAFTYVNPFVQAGQGATPRCYLKNAVPAARNDSCCTSGMARLNLRIDLIKSDALIRARVGE